MGICNGRRVAMNEAASDNANQVASVLAAAGAVIVEAGADITLNVEAASGALNVSLVGSAGAPLFRVKAQANPQDETNMLQAIAWLVSDDASQLESIDVELSNGEISVLKDGQLLGGLNKGSAMAAYEIGAAITTLVGRA